MAEVAPAAAPADPVVAPKKKASRPKNPGLNTAELVLKAVTACQDRKGISFVALRKELAVQGYDIDNNTVYIKRAIKYLLGKGSIVQTKGTGAVGSYKAGKAAEKPKKAAAKKAAPAKKPAAAKKTKAATPKKAKKSAAAKRTPVKKSTKSPKKTAVKKAAAPEKAVKKAVKPKKAAAEKPAKK